MKIKNYLTTFSQTHWLFVFIAATFGFIFVVITPPLWGIDETSHFARVYQIAHGDVIPDRNKDSYGGVVPQNLINLIDYTKSDLMDNTGGNPWSRKDVTNLEGYSVFINTKFSDKQAQYLWSASYSPVAYAGHVIGTFLAAVFNLPIDHTLMYARLGGLAVYILIVAISLYLLKESRIRWLIFTVALFPAIMFLASVVTADSMAIALSLLFSALFIRLQAKNIDKSLSRKLLIGIMLVAIALPLIKINYIFISLGVLFVPRRYFKTKTNEVIKKTSTIIAAVGLSLLWSVVAKVTSEAPITQRPDGVSISSSDQLAYVLHHPIDFITAFSKTVVLNFDSYIQSSVSHMGWNWVFIPNTFVIILICLTLFALVYAKNEIRSAYSRKTAIWLALFAVAGVCSIYFALYLAYNPVGNYLIDGIQGRYFIPLIMPILVLLTYLLPIDLKVRLKFVTIIFAVTSVVCLAVGVTYFFLALY